MFFKKNYIKCYGYCSDKSTQYGVDDDGRNTFLNVLSISILEPESLKNKVLYQYDEEFSSIEIGQHLYVNLNYKTGEFKIVKVLD